MDGLPDNVKILKSLIAPARHSDGPTLYIIGSADDRQCHIYEQMPDGKCIVWPDGPSQGVQQAECTIYQWASGQG